MTMAVPLALLLGFVVLAVLVIRLSRSLQQCLELLRRLYEQAQLVNGLDDGASEPSEALAAIGISPGYRLPTAFRVVHEDGEWVVAVVADGTDHPLLAELADQVVPSVGSSYVVSALVADDGGDAGASPEGLRTVRVPGDALPPLTRPAVFLVDPEAVVQGVGAPVSASDILAFVVEGEQRGFGPGNNAHRTALR